MQASAAAPDRTGSFRVDVLIERKEEASRIVEFLARPEVRLAVLHGRTNCGKTKLVRNFVIPALKDRVFYGRTTPDLPDHVSSGGTDIPISEALAQGGTLFLDEFDQLLSAGGKQRMEQAGSLLARFHRGELRGTLVLILQEENLSHLLAFRTNAPSLLDNTFEIKGLPLEEHIRKLGEYGGPLALSYAPELLERLGQDLEEFGALGSGDIAEAVDWGFRHYKHSSPDRLITAADYAGIGFLPGVIRRCLDARMDAAELRFGKGAGQITKAIADEVVEAARFSRAPDFREIAPRLGVDKSKCDEVVAWAGGDGRLLKTDAKEGISLIPRELARVLEIEFETQWRESGEVRKILADGLRGKKQLGALLPKERFDQVNRVRTRLKTTEEETALVVLSAIHCADDAGDATYWLSRVRGDDEQVSVLIEALFSDSALARTRAARMLAAFEDEEVRGQLYRRALEDSDAGVRAQAVESLQGMQTEELWPLLEKEAIDTASPYRQNAIEAMRLCRCARCVATLKRIVDEPAPASFRITSIRALAAIDLPEAVDALVHIGLDDDHDQDRAEAAAALASLRSPELVARSLECTRAAKLKTDEEGWELLERPLHAGTRIVLSILLLIGNVFIPGLALIPFRRYTSAVVFMLVHVSILALLPVLGLWAVIPFLANWVASHFAATRVAMASVGQRWWRFRITRILGGVFFLGCTGSFLIFHGSAHALVGRWKRAGSLFMMELAGLLVLGLAWYRFYDYRLAHHLLEQIFYGFFWFYALAGAIFFAVSFWMDAKVIFRESFLLADRGVARQRKEALLGHVLATPAGTRAALQMAESTQPQASRWARKAILRPPWGISQPDLIASLEARGESAPAFLRGSLARNKTDESIRELAGLWDRSGSPGLRRGILRVFLSDPSEQSLREAGRRLKDLDWLGRVQYRVSRWSYPLRLWPKALTWGAALMAPFLLYALTEALLSAQNPAHNLTHHMRTSLSRGDESGFKTAKFLAEVYPRESAHEILEHYSGQTALEESLAILACGELDKSTFAELQVTLGSSLVDTFIKAGQQHCPGNLAVAGVLTKEARTSLADTAASVESVKLGVRALETAGTQDAIDVLAQFVVRERTTPRLREVGKALREEGSRRQDLDLKMHAVDALIRIGSPQAIRALESVAIQTPSDELRQQVYKRIPARESSDPIKVVQAALERADYQRAIKAGAAATGLDPDQQRTLDALLGESNYRLSLDKKEEKERLLLEDTAIVHFNRAQEHRRDNTSARALAEIYNIRGERLRAAGKLYPALNEAGRGIAADPAYPDIRGTQGVILLELGENDQALAAFSKAVDLDPKYAWAYCMQAQIRLDQRDYAAAEQLATAAIEADSTYSWSFHLLSESYTQRNPSLGGDAIKRFEELERQHPSIYWPGRQLAVLYHDHLPKEDGSGLERSYQKWLEIDKKFVDSLDPATLKNHRANFLESRFTTGRHADVLKEGPVFAAQLKDDHDNRIPVILLTYASAVLLNENNAAREALNALDAALTNLPARQRIPWNYSGTLEYLRAQRAPEPVVSLIEAAGKLRDGTPIPRELIARNRKAL